MTMSSHFFLNQIVGLLRVFHCPILTGLRAIRQYAPRTSRWSFCKVFFSSLAWEIPEGNEGFNCFNGGGDHENCEFKPHIWCSMDWFKGQLQPKTPYLLGKSIVCGRFSYAINYPIKMNSWLMGRWYFPNKTISPNMCWKNHITMVGFTGTSAGNHVYPTFSNHQI